MREYLERYRDIIYIINLQLVLSDPIEYFFFGGVSALYVLESLYLLPGAEINTFGTTLQVLDPD